MQCLGIDPAAAQPFERLGARRRLRPGRRMAIVVAPTADAVMLYCFHYDPSTGKYGLAVLRLMRGGAILTLLGMGLMGFVFWRRSKAKTQGLE